MTDQQKLEKVERQIKTAGEIHKRDLIRQAQRLRRKIKHSNGGGRDSLSRQSRCIVCQRLQGCRQ